MGKLIIYFYYISILLYQYSIFSNFILQFTIICSEKVISYTNGIIFYLTLLFPTVCNLYHFIIISIMMCILSISILSIVLILYIRASFIFKLYFLFDLNIHEERNHINLKNKACSNIQNQH